MVFLNGNKLDIRAEINEIEYKKTTEKIYKTKNWFFENIYKLRKKR